MPEYLAPGVYVEETSFRAKSIEGVSTSTAGFVGPARYGPTDGLPELVTSFAEFERIFGSMDRLEHLDSTERSHNYLAHGVRAFFENGGKRVYVSRIYALPEGDDLPQDQQAVADARGRASHPLGGITVSARFPGRAGESRVAFTLRVGGNVLANDPDPATGAPFGVLRGVNPDDVVWVADPTSPPGALPSSGTLVRAERFFDDAIGRSTWRLHPATGDPILLSDLNPEPGAETIHLVTLAVEVTFLDRTGKVTRQETWDALGFHPEARRSVSMVFAEVLPSRTQHLRTPIVVELGGLDNGPTVVEAFLAQLAPDLGGDLMAARDRRFEVALQNGSDGLQPLPRHYVGTVENDGRVKSGLLALEDIPDISIVAAPGYSAGGNDDPEAVARTQTVTNALISHAERMQYRIAVLDAAEEQGLADVRAQRAQIDTTHGALYYPWVRVLDPVTDQEIVLPPSGFVAGIYARNDVQHGVHKAPANEVVRGALGFEYTLNKAQQDVLNPEGINCFRFFEGRGNRLWGARTASSDPEWKYVNLRRYFAYLERSIERGTQWVVFENNHEPLWANVRRTVEDFLFSEWNQAHLMGDKPENAYFVRCDRSTMTQNDLDNGRLVCLIGVAPVRPAEFVIFRIGQWTGDRKS
jgi:uncharacterized protein